MHSFIILFCLVLSLFLPASNALHITNQTVDDFLLSQYDHVVVGGGLSGLVVANRLSEDANTTVLVIEAGDLDRREDHVIIPGFIGRSPPSPYGHSVRTTPQVYLDGQTRGISQGKVVGGGSARNGMCWTRGSAADFDAWEELGNPGWGWNGLLPYFKKVETYTTNVPDDVRDRFNINPDMSSHGTSGPIDVAYSQHFYNTSNNILQGLSEIGIPIAADVNAGDPTGAMIVPSSMSPENQTRSDARTGYFDPAISRPNFHVITGHTATRLMVGLPGSLNRGGRRILGVHFSSGPAGVNRTVTANKEVILAAGAIQSPVLLQVSGIGPRQVLESLNISVQINLPGVGNNFQDHPMAQFPFDYSNSSIFTSRDLNGDAFEEALDTFLANRTGPLTTPLINTVAFPSLQNHSAEWETLLEAARNRSSDFLPLDTPRAVVSGYAKQKSLLLCHLARRDVGAYELLAASWGQISIANQKPLSRGTVRPSSASVFDAPLVDPRYCADPLDCKIIRLGLQLTQKLMMTEAMKPLLPVVDARFNSTDEMELMAALKPLVGTEYHPSGSASMLPRKLGGVVNDKLMVYGTCNLRVVDAGMMPMIPGGHIQAAVYAVAEKAADIIKAASNEPCIQGHNGSGAVFFSGCNLRCVFCQNHDIAHQRNGRDLTPEELGEWYLKLQQVGHVHNINLVTPEHVVPQVVLSILHAKDLGLKVPIIYNTSAFDSLASLELLDGLVDIYLPDFKVWEASSSKRLLKADDYAATARESIKAMHAQVGDLCFTGDGIAKKGLLVRHLVMPGKESEGQRIMKFLAEEVSRDCFVNIMEQYHPDAHVGKAKRRTKTSETPSDEVRYAEINRAVSEDEISSVRQAAEAAGLWRFCDPPRHDGFNI
ncbi:GMC oxidoreductase [Colletotrichum sojae]|uniref:GMC oxidoreductase n=1 Tax=Colletotrichum sojae TaxID=2175907 RepID=A0A8H6MM79_9PEZI|nr:GMC oxidoreductase [Colletotrichum sojae]